MIGVIADDFTGATDVAVAFRRAGLRAAVIFGMPEPTAVLPEAEVLVIGLKSRTIPASEAVDQSLAALRKLQETGATQFYFKFCSTFDSRPEGNIGPVADALAAALSARVVLVSPSSPEHGRTQYQGHLFVGDSLLSESPMRHHPLTPMTDSFIPRVLAAQTTTPVSLISVQALRSPSLAQMIDTTDGFVVADSITDSDLAALGRAIVDHPLVAGAAGLAGGWGLALASKRVAGVSAKAREWPSPGRAAVLAGSCSARTLEQLERVRQTQPSFHLDALRSQDPATLAAEALQWFDQLPENVVPVIASSLPPSELHEVQVRLGAARASSVLEAAIGMVAQGLSERGVRRFVIAGGETSGAVVSALGVDGGEIGGEEAPGVPWIYPSDERGLALLLKSGNFGDIDLLLRASSATTPGKSHER
jgi:uncharacterized protein YgbK (DUF1537 family)